MATPASRGASRVKLNRNAFKVESGSVPKRRRRVTFSASEPNHDETGGGEKASLTGYAADFNWKAKLERGLESCTGSGSGKRIKRLVTNPYCALCGEIKYVPPRSRKLARNSKSTLRPSGPPGRQERQAEGCLVIRVPQTARLVFWLGKYPMVKLCDVARVFDVTSRDFSCVLPLVLQRKRKRNGVRCFKKEFGALAGLCGDDRRWIVSQSWKVCTPTNSCGSLSSGEVTEGTTRTLDNVVERTPGQEISLQDCGCVPSSSQEIGTGKETSGFRAPGLPGSLDNTLNSSVPILTLRRVPACKASGPFPHIDHGVDPNSLEVREEETPSSCLQEKGSCEGSQEEVYPPDLFSCQRTREYVACRRPSCARTYRSWPFPRRGPPCELKSSVRAGPRWIEASVGLECKVCDGSRGSTPTGLRAVVKENLRKLIGTKETTIGALKNHTAIGTLTKIAADSLSVSLKGLEERKKAPIQADDCRMASPCQRSLGVSASDSFPQNQSTTHGTLEKTDAIKVPCNQNVLSSPSTNQPNSSAMRSDKIFGIPSCEKVRVPQTSSECHRSSSAVGRLSFPLDKIKKRTEAPTCSPPSSPLLKVCPGPQTRPPSPAASCSEVEPQRPSSVIHPTEVGKQSPNEASENTKNFSMVLQRPKTATSILSSKNSMVKTRTFNNLTMSTLSSSCGVDELSSQFSAFTSEDDEAKPRTDNEVRSPNESPTSLSTPPQPAISFCDLDVMRAYEEDAIILDVIQDDPDLFGPLVPSLKSEPVPVEKSSDSWQKPPARVRQRIVWESKSPQKGAGTAGDVQLNNGSHSGVMCGPPQCSKTPLWRSWSSVYPLVNLEEFDTDCNNNPDKGATADMNVVHVEQLGSTQHPVQIFSGRDGSFLRPSFETSYCWYYFSEHHLCLRRNCQYLHVPKDEDEKFCMEMVQKFCRVGTYKVQQAVEVFVRYYRRSSPGTEFNQNVVNMLLFTLLSLALLSNLVSVVNTLLTHKKTPPPELVMAFYEHVRKRGLISYVSELLNLTSRVIEMGCVFTVENFEVMHADLQMLQVPKHQMDLFLALKCRALAGNPNTALGLEFTQVVMRVELCRQQENWPSLGSVFCSVFAGHYSAAELTRFCCCVTMALLKEPKDRLTVPYEPFAVSVSQDMVYTGLVKSFLGRVGISLMFRYHRNQEWAKGTKLVHTMSRLRLDFSKLKGLFSSEEGVSCCQLITTATELFLNSGSIEDALTVLRAAEWFVSSSVWPCETPDVEGRRRVLMSLAERTSLRDTLEVLTNLPGLGQPIDGVRPDEYCSVFTTHLQKCVSSHALPVAADTLEFMLARGIPADAALLQNLVHRLGKQNIWSRARNLFKRARSAGYYSEVTWEMDSLTLPSRLSEIEMTLAFEMFITCVGADLQNTRDLAQPLVITLRRCSGGEAVMESDYLASGSCLLSAALIPNPKLSVHYWGVTHNQEQLFHMDSKSAIKWLTHNRSWAEMWAS